MTAHMIGDFFISDTSCFSPIIQKTGNTTWRRKILKNQIIILCIATLRKPLDSSFRQRKIDRFVCFLHYGSQSPLLTITSDAPPVEFVNIAATQATITGKQESLFDILSSLTW